MNKHISTYVLAFSIFCLAGAIIYFTVTLTHVNNALPRLIEQVDETALRVTPLIDEVADIKALVPSIVHEVEQVRLMVPDVLTQAEKIETLTPSVLAEVAAVRVSIAQITEEVAQVRALMPDVLTRVDDVNRQVPTITRTVDGFTQELGATNNHIPAILTEIETTRTSIPPILSRAEAMVAELGTVGKTSGEEAVYGVVSGIIKAPLKVVEGLGKALTLPFEQSESWIQPSDKALMRTLIEQFLSQNNDKMLVATNPETKNVSRVSLDEDKKLQGKTCKVLQLEVDSVKGQHVEHKMTLCLSQNNTWQVVN
ncbi:hypothetical protein LP316_03910 [Thalassotalea sp. LPB0316]|uniref:hypothetical protein n=1 Tax=Thalassotalea sp. LPB0316 TaxID=2769490 RepID=UPI001865E75D|nr:hypothetical protein [Thalassotalea sp. LPB0316]QOL26454.1 hypothetical protein LP316_03910 [Thalassotalea sp. LPB0316]